MPERARPGDSVRAAPPAGPQLGDWNLLRSFIAVYEAGTLTEAARRLATTQPSVGRHVRELERALGEALFVRQPGRLKPTERAHALYDVVSAMKASAREAERLFAGARHALVGTVRVTASEVYATHVVAPLVACMLSEQPGLEIELSVSNQAENLLRREADIAVRFFRPEQDGLITMHVGDTELGLYAHESLLRRYGEPEGFDIPDAAFVAGFDREVTPLAPMVRGEPPSRPLRFRLRTDSMLARHAAVEAGMGIGAYLVDVAAAKPCLRRVLAERFGQKQEVWLCAHDELRRSASMRYVWSRLEQTLRARLAPASARPGPRAPAALDP
ncbi:MAG: LysR family transcriptional regulator [Burkholderiaceae bacterium]|jgi:DNA-binding transcriptional LysR family regulator|nr:LysR family transcriptional regulator [Burkholderiales bacterium]MCZ8339196.1 LysR family transcriptional regulator [Burkholderiaceae bacterium]